jgi:glyoxylase-like metal-dependent hydrolase (beta-lactamase superfamily II)
MSRPLRFRVSRVSERMHFVHTEHVNWAIYVGSDGVTLIDSGYVGQRELLIASLSEVGCRADDVAAVLVTHGHADHLGGAAWLAERFGIPVYTHAGEVANVRRTIIEQAGVGDILGNVLRPGVARWALAIAPLLDRRAGLGVPSAAAVPEAGDRIVVPGRPRAVLVEGHTSGHAAFDFDHEGVLVVGDSLVTGHGTSPIVGPQLLPSMFHHDAPAARASVELLAASSARILLPGHGEPWIGPAEAAVSAALASGWAW